jgi:glutathione S-transferase
VSDREGERMHMKLYMTPGSCSTAIHILLEELEEVFEAHIVNLPAGDQFKPDYLAINPKANIPALVLADGAVLTEVPAIAFWLGKTRRKGKFWPADPGEETRALETMIFVASTIHGQGFARHFAPGNFCPDSSLHESIKAQGLALAQKSLALVDRQLEGRDWITENYSAADPVLFYVVFWADKVGLKLPPNILRHYRAMLARPAVIQVLREEGYRPETLGQRAQSA